MDEVQEPIDVKFRYIFNTAEEDPQLACAKVSGLLGALTLDQRSFKPKPVSGLTLGVEKLNKYGEPTHKHLHIHFSIVDTIGAIRKRVQRFFKSDNEPRTGNSLYSCKDEPDVKDRDRFFRYPFKQSGTEEWPTENDLCKKHNIFPEAFDYKQQIAFAYEEWKRDVEFHRANKERDENKVSTKMELFEWLESIPAEQKKDERTILTSILKFYTETDKSANKNTIMGYLNTALLKLKIKTYEEMADDWLK